MAGLDALDLNSIDVFIMLATLVIVGIAFTQGLIRQVLYLLSSYVALVVASQYHRPTGLWLNASIPAGDAVLSGFAFIVLFLLTLATMLSLSHHLYQSTLIPQAGAFDNLGGALVGIVTAYLIVTVSLAVIHFATGDIWPEYNTVRVTTSDSLGHSRLASVVNGYSPLVFGTLKPWLPGGLPAIFSTS